MCVSVCVILYRHETTQVDLLPKSPAEGLLLLPGRSGMVELHFSDIDFNVSHTDTHTHTH